MRTIFGIKRQDLADTVAAFATLFAILTGHAVLETARDTLFLAHLGAAELPWVYLAITALVILASRANRALVSRLRKRRLLSASLVVAAITTGAFWLLAGAGDWILYGLYVWSGLIVTMLVVQFWLVMNDVFNVSQAKRSFAFVGVGGILGAIAGSLLARVLVEVVAPHDLVLASALIFLLAAALPFTIRCPTCPVPDRRKPAALDAVTWSLREPYLKRLLWLVFFGSATVTIVDFVFKSMVEAELAPEAYGSFFAQYYAGINTLGLVIQVLLAPWLLRRLGVTKAAVVLPALLLGGATVVVAAAGLGTVMVLRGVDGALRHSVNRTSTELLYLPLSAELRNRAKAVIDGVGQRVGQTVASLGILAVTAAGVRLESLGWIVLGLTVLWLLGGLGLKDHYVRLFRHRLREGTTTTRIDLPDLDLHALEALLEAVNSSDDREVKAALDMFAAHGKIALIPATILYHPAPDVVLHAFELFDTTGRRDAASVAKRLLGHHDIDIRTAALRTYAFAAPNENILRRHLTADSGAIRVTALVGLTAAGMLEPSAARVHLAKTLREADLPTRLALARAIRHREGQLFAEILIRLGERKEPELQIEVAQAMATQPRLSFVPHLVQMLAHRRARPAVHQALLAVGEVALASLETLLADLNLPARVRQQLPSVIGAFESTEAADVLLRRFASETDGRVRYRILTVLNRMVQHHPRLRLDIGTICRATRNTLKRIIRIMDARIILRLALEREPTLRTETGRLLVSILEEKEGSAIERLFRLFHLLRPAEDFRLVQRGLASPDPKRRANSRELLEHILPTHLREPVLALAGDEDDAGRLERAAAALGDVELSTAAKDGPRAHGPLQACLTRLLSDDSQVVSALTASFIGEQKWQELTGQLAEARSRQTDAEVFDRALESLSSMPAGGS